ncbi:ribonuclease R [Candidatus Mycoplasma haematohominis]|uniref:ribonuclease R n=1 Tax=Candidatus Mycoplasma haematohominis TaxID=1494318 RepID=UPI001C0A6FB8|nr:ribonuclease R [Candidatus Mycoplasma haemohominis]
MDPKLKEDLQNSIVKVLESDPRPMTLNFMMHKVFKEIQELHPSVYVTHKDFSVVLDELLKKYWVGRTKHNKYYLDYLDYEETGVEGEGYLEVDFFTGHGYITVKRNYREYKKASYFVHKKNIGSSKTGDYVRFVGLNNTKPRDFSFKDAAVKEVLPKPKIAL